MTQAALYCILAVAVILGVLSVVFKSNTGFLNFSVKLLAPISFLLLALVGANLSSSFGGYTVFIAIGLAFTIAEEAFKCVKKEPFEKNDTVFIGVLNSLTLVCFLLAGIILIKFNIFALAFGLLLGLGTSALIAIFRKLKVTEFVLTAINITLCAMILGQAIALILAGVTLGVTILYFISAFLGLFQIIFSVFVKGDRIMNYISTATRILSLITLAFSISFMI